MLGHHSITGAISLIQMTAMETLQSRERERHGKAVNLGNSLCIFQAEIISIQIYADGIPSYLRKNLMVNIRDVSQVGARRFHVLFGDSN